MKASFRVVAAGPACTIQDQGRHGFLRFGVTTAGPMDWVGHCQAHHFAGNPSGGAAIEIGPGGLHGVADDGPIRIGISAPGFTVSVNGENISSHSAVTLKHGERIKVSPGQSHVWAYLAWCGTAHLEPVMGSFSTHVRSGVGPLNGHALSAGGTISVEQATAAIRQPLVEYQVEAPSITQSLRFIPGPQMDYFTPEAFENFCRSEYFISLNCDRMGYRLNGDPISHAQGHDIVSDGIVMGSVQIPGHGQPIVLMADHQPTGGYPKIGTVIRADLPLLAQARSGTSVRFQPVSVEDAVVALRGSLLRLKRIKPKPAQNNAIDVDLLASGNYASGVISALM